MIQEFFVGNNLAFMPATALCKNAKLNSFKIKKIDRPEAALARYLFEMGGYENGRPIPVVKKMAEAGYFKGLLSNRAERLAKKKGILPDGFQVHHIVPLKLGGTSEISNLCIVDAETHSMLHQFIYQPVLNRLNENEEGILVLPEFKRVITKEDRNLFFLYSELRRHELKKMGLKRIRKVASNRNADMGFRDAYTQSQRMRGY